MWPLTPLPVFMRTLGSVNHTTPIRYVKQALKAYRGVTWTNIMLPYWSIDHS